ncbi:hypothetical protein BJV78DRAFT_1174272, partial [Lactifluus subvellereus]
MIVSFLVFLLCVFSMTPSPSDRLFCCHSGPPRRYAPVYRTCLPMRVWQLGHGLCLLWCSSLACSTTSEFCLSTHPPGPPPESQHFLSRDDLQAMVFRHHIRYYNTAFSFTSFDLSFDTDANTRGHDPWVSRQAIGRSCTFM